MIFATPTPQPQYPQEPQWPSPSGKGKGGYKGKDGGKNPGKAKDGNKGRGRGGKGKDGGKAETKSKGKIQWASYNGNSLYCWAYAKGRCTSGTCNRIHKCPLMPEGTWVCNGKHIVADCPYNQ